MEMMTFEEFEKKSREQQIMSIAENMEKAKEDDTPYLAIADENINVIGNPNKTERKPTTYRIRFCFPKNDYWRSRIGEENILEETRDYLVTRRVYKDVIVPVSRHPALVAAFAELQSFFKVINGNGDVRDMSEDEMKSVLKQYSGDVIDSAFDVLYKLLKIPADEVEHMHPIDALYAVALLTANTEEIPNEGDVFLR